MISGMFAVATVAERGRALWNIRADV